MIELSRKAKARISRQLRNAVEKGPIEKPDKCNGCNNPGEGIYLHGHHEDYSKPFEVEWLCYKCHGLTRRRVGRVEHSKPKWDKNRDRTAYRGVKLPILKDNPFVNRGLLQQNSFLDEHKYFDAAIDWEPYLEQLTYREREIIKLRYGISDGYIYTLQEIGKIFKVTRERVRCVEAKTIMKLRKMVF